jgi:hypothetical protein
MARYYWIQTLLKQIQMFTSLHEIEVTKKRRNADLRSLLTWSIEGDKGVRSHTYVGTNDR